MPDTPMDPTAMMPQTDPMQAQAAAPTDGMATPEQKQQLMDLLAKIRQQMSEVNAAQFVRSNAAQQKSQETLKEVFHELQAAGVDLTDPKSISQFLSNLREQSPDLAQLFEQVLNSLMGGGAEEQAPMDMPSDMGNMNNDQATQAAIG